MSSGRTPTRRGTRLAFPVLWLAEACPSGIMTSGSRRSPSSTAGRSYHATTAPFDASLGSPCGPTDRAGRGLLFQLREQLHEPPVRPAEADLVARVPEADPGLHVRLAAHHVVLLDDRPVLAELLRDQGEELLRDPVRILLEAGAAQTLRADELERRPAERRVPLVARRLRAREQPAGRFELREVLLDA